jgi:hypothetical protein
MKALSSRFSRARAWQTCAASSHSIDGGSGNAAEAAVTQREICARPVREK